MCSKFIFPVFIAGIAYLQINAQSIGIGTTSPNASAMLDVQSTSKGILIPKMTQAQRAAIATPATGLLVFQTDNTPGFYYNSGTPAVPVWTLLSSTANSAWSIAGNSGINAANNFLGTTDNHPLNFRVNNLSAGQLNPANGNVFLGLSTGKSSTAAFSNIAIGSGALFNNTDRANLVAIGDSALFSNTSVGTTWQWEAAGNTAIGSKSLYSNSIGYNLTSVGSQTLFNNTTGTYNTAIGTYSLLKNTTGYYNTAIGADVQQNNITGTNNTSVGTYSLYYNDEGSFNSGLGVGVLENNTTGNNNTAVGTNTLMTNRTGSSNTALGSGALVQNTADNNTAVGHLAYYATTTGVANTGLGYQAGLGNITGSFNIAIGNNAGSTASVSNTISIGNDGWLNNADNQVFIGNNSTIWIGGLKPWSVYSDAKAKSNIKEDIKGLDFILKLKPVSYYQKVDDITAATGNKSTTDFPGKHNADKIRMNGFIAQEVEKAASEAGYQFSGVSKVKSVNELYSLSYESFVVPLVKAVQEQEQKIQQQQKQIDDLLLQIQQLKLLVKPGI